MSRGNRKRVSGVTHNSTNPCPTSLTPLRDPVLRATHVTGVGADRKGSPEGRTVTFGITGQIVYDPGAGRSHIPCPGIIAVNFSQI
jgi:hypothetical protein